MKGSNLQANGKLRKSVVLDDLILPIGMIVYSRFGRQMVIVQHYKNYDTGVLLHYGLNPTDKSYHGDVPACGWPRDWIVVPGQQLDLFGGAV